ncbi:phospholipase B1, membrane-associated-like isoform X2 [Megachile rotundata]|uniref:phospholipase B1, membrane-associated-like isoform X2 n=1 Tax=Megachile rotundata TaxID=143995 RepID=UPI003FCF1033
MSKFVCVVISCVLIAAQKTEWDSPENMHNYRNFRKWIFHKFGGRSPKVPDSVHRLRPGDIDVIAAMGDSVTAGAAIFASNIMQILVENRGVAASIGGQGNWRTFLTLPNILKEFNPNLLGYSRGDSLIYHSNSHFNVAETGAMARDMPFMARYLIDRMKQDSRVNIKEHWKLISILIGHNDFCIDVCVAPSPSSILKTYRRDLINTLRILRDNLPRTFVVVTMMFSFSRYVDAMKTQRILRCYIMVRLSCPCMFGLQYQDRISEYHDMIKRWAEMEEDIVNYQEFNTKDFTVISSPVLQNYAPPLTEDGQLDMTNFSYDCFHPVQKTNARYANALWNSLLEPVGNKSRGLRQENWTKTAALRTCSKKCNRNEQNKYGKNSAANRLLVLVRYPPLPSKHINPLRVSTVPSCTILVTQYNIG